MTSGDSPEIHPTVLQSPSGLSVHVNVNGSIRRIVCSDILVNLFVGSEMEGGPSNIYLRDLGRGADAIEWTPLLGPASAARIHLDENGLTARGEWNGIRFAASLVLAQSATAWFWHAELENAGREPRTVDLIYAQDMALAHYGAVRMNEYYVSQYVDFTPLAHPERGAVLAVRQNLAMGGRHPWAAIGSLGKGVSYATDALQLHGLATRAGGRPAGLASRTLAGRRQQHEHAMAVVQDAELRLEPGARARRGFFGWIEADHPDATSAADLRFVDSALALPEAADVDHRPADSGGEAAAATLFSSRPVLDALDLGESEIARLFGGERRAVERDGTAVLSFFTGAANHVVLRAKELRVLRPHGHMIRTGGDLVPDEASLTSTAWMAGVFHSLVTQGHVGINRLLSATRSYLGLFKSLGQRVFVELDDGYHLLDVPSAFEMTPNGCRWVYKHVGGTIEVRSWAPIDRHELYLAIAVTAGAPRRFLVCNHVSLNGDDGAEPIPVLFERDGGAIAIRAIAESDVGRRFPNGTFRIEAIGGTVVERAGGDELLYADGCSRREPYLAIVTAPAPSVAFRITGKLVPSAAATASASVDPAADETRAARFWQRMTGPLALRAADGSPLAADVANLQEILPWLAHDAMIHYLAPRGLEQFSGGGWGTRDICQGPVELLLALGDWDAMRDLLIRVFRNQNADGDWPQWFMFFERERGIRPDDSHGDIVFWPPLALAEYICASGDAAILDETVPFFHAEGDERAEKATIAAHVERALAVIAKRRIPETDLAAYGHGDWNDSLQPVNPAMRERLCSAWTVTLHHYTVSMLAEALRRAGRSGAEELEATAACIRADLQRLLIADDTLAGFAYFHEDGRVEHMLHPRDQSTGIHYRLLPMIHAILYGVLTPEQAMTHIGYMQRHLLGADGARLFDRPPEYRGGPQRYFQRAESSTYFGREIGIMYTHAHLRYAESMARHGDADALFLALRQINPIGIRAAVPNARPRQANCYYSSSDAAVADRYEGLSRYQDIRSGKIPVEGGWRVYSSGAGIWMRILHQCLLGLRRGKSHLVVDPVLPKALDGLTAEIELMGQNVTVLYEVGDRGCGPQALILNRTHLTFEREANPYRTGGAVVSMELIADLLHPEANLLIVQLG